MTPSFRSIGGTIVWGSKPLTDGEVLAQVDLALAEHDACLRIGDRAGARVARSMFLDLTDAIKEQARWVRCSQLRRAA